MEEDPEIQMIIQAAQKLGEHFDTIHIFTTKHTYGYTSTFQYGTGNWYARYGQVLEWVEKQQELLRCKVREDSKEED